jgi:hypothetical protein
MPRPKLLFVNLYVSVIPVLGYCYHLVNVITLNVNQNNHSKLCPHYFILWIQQTIFVKTVEFVP